MKKSLKKILMLSFHFTTFFARKALTITLSAIFLLTVLPGTTSAQQNIISPLTISIQDLDQEQTIRYNKVIASGIHSSYQFVHIEPLATRQLDGKIVMSFAHMPCSSTATFLAENVEYREDDNNYYWYGNIVENATDTCVPGSAMLLAVNGEHFGQVELGNKTFELFELTGGVQLIAAIKTEANYSYCGTTNKTTKPSGTSGSEDPGGFCKVRVLVLYTPSAITNDPNISNRIDLAIWQTKQALLNSDIPPSYLHLLLAGKQEIRYSEDPFYIEKDAYNMTSFDSRTGIASNILFARNHFRADIVIMLTKKTNSGIKGLVAGHVQNADSPYAVMQVVHATNSSFTFVHEFAHILGARHQDVDDSPDNDDTLSMAHAHKFTSSTLPFLFKSGKTIPYGNTLNDGSAVLHFSNPAVYYWGAATGAYTSTYGARNTAQQIKNIACTVAGYNAVDSGDLSCAISVTGSVCASSHDIVYSRVTGHLYGVYHYAWQTATDGINYGPVIATTEDLDFIMPPAVFRLYFRLTVTDPSGAVTYAYTNTRRRVPGSCGTIKLAGVGDLEASISLSPIPAADHLDIGLDHSESGKTRVDLFDPMGRFIRNVFEGDTEKGRQLLTTDTRDLQNGIYLLRLSTEQFLCTKKLIIYR